jgi:hypothetical protein
MVNVKAEDPPRHSFMLFDETLRPTHGRGFNLAHTMYF